MNQPKQTLLEVLSEVTSSFNYYNVNYLIIGGIAVNFHGYNRQSHHLPENIDFDIDIWYEPTVTNFTNLTIALKSLSIPRADELDQIVFDSNKTFLRILHNNFKLELLTNIEGFTKSEFFDCYQRRIVFDLEGIDVSIISLDDLISNKKAMSRPLDQKDIEELRKRNDS